MKGGSDMDAVFVTRADAKEIAALVLAVQERRPTENKQIDVDALAHCAVRSIQNLSARLEAKYGSEPTRLSRLSG